MMTSALVLIAAILLLGGLLAALGDYLGTKVGKARLRVFKLRPRQTATLVTVLTGTMIAASTLGILFATSGSLRKGIFRLDEYLNRLQQARDDLSAAIQAREKVEKELAAAEEKQAEAQQELDAINRKFQSAQNQLDAVSQEVTQLNKQLSQLKQEREKLLEQRDKLEAQIEARDEKLATQQEQLQITENKLEELEKQKSQLQAEIKKQDNKIAKLDQEIETKDEVLQFQQKEVKALEEEISSLQKEIQALEQYYDNFQALRQGNVSLVKGEVLAFNVVQIGEDDSIEKVINEMLRQANRRAIKTTQPGNEKFQEQIIMITNQQIERLKEVLKTGDEYVVQIVSAGNYLSGEKQIRVFADVVRNQTVFEAGEVIASLSLNPQDVKEGKLSERIDLLLASSRFRARQSGIVGQVTVGENYLDIVDFMDDLAALNKPYDQIQAIAKKPSSNAGPLELQLKVKQGEDVILTN